MLITAKNNSSKSVLGFNHLTAVFMFFFLILLQTLTRIEDPFCLAKALLEGGRGKVNPPPI